MRIPLLDLVRVVAMFFVLLIHSPGDGDYITTPAMTFFKEFIGSGAVPLFFMLSGYLGLRKLQQGKVSFYDFLKSRYHSLIIPYVFWNGLLLLIIVLLKLVHLDRMLRGGGAYFDFNLSPSSVLEAFGIGRHFPILHQFWFLRDLIIVEILAFFIYRYIPNIPLLALLIFALPVDGSPSLGFYLTGCWLSKVLPESKYPTLKASYLYCILWAIIGCVSIAAVYNIPSPLQQFCSAGFLFMLCSILLSTSLGKSLTALGPAVFFVYATHMPFQSYLAKLWQVFHIPLFGSFACFILLPLTTMIACLAAYHVLHRYFKTYLLFVTGGR